MRKILRGNGFNGKMQIMKRLVILLAVIGAVVSCTKSEKLTICFANAYDQTVTVSGYGEDLSIKAGKLQPIALCSATGESNHIDVQSLWKAFFYDKYDTLVIYAEDNSVLETWTKGDTRPGNPFDIASWSKEEKVESGVDGGLKEGLAYAFLVSAYTRTDYNLTYVIAPRE